MNTNSNLTMDVKQSVKSSITAVSLGNIEQKNIYS